MIDFSFNNYYKSFLVYIALVFKIYSAFKYQAFKINLVRKD